MTELNYTVELKSFTKHKEAITSKGYPVDFLTDVFLLLKRMYGFDASLLKLIVTKHLIEALENNDICYLKVKE